MAFEVLPLSFKPHRVEALSDRLPVSHYEDNYGGAVRCLNAIESRLAGLDRAGAPPVRPERARTRAPCRRWPLAFDAPVLSGVDLWALVLPARDAGALPFPGGLVTTLLASSLAGVLLYLAGAVR